LFDFLPSDIPGGLHISKGDTIAVLPYDQKDDGVVRESHWFAVFNGVGVVSKKGKPDEVLQTSLQTTLAHTVDVTDTRLCDMVLF
jgi:hypothetical protein